MDKLSMQEVALQITNINQLVPTVMIGLITASIKHEKPISPVQIAEESYDIAKAVFKERQSRAESLCLEYGYRIEDIKMLLGPIF